MNNEIEIKFNANNLIK